MLGADQNSLGNALAVIARQRQARQADTAAAVGRGDATQVALDNAESNFRDPGWDAYFGGMHDLQSGAENAGLKFRQRSPSLDGLYGALQTRTLGGPAPWTQG